MSLQGLVTSQRLEEKKMKNKKFRRDTRFFNDVFFLKKSTATRCKNCQGTPNFGIHEKIVL